MATDPRRFDMIERVVGDERRHLADVESTVLSRLSSHTHFGSSIPVVASTGTITAPFTGQIILNTTDMLLYRYNGSAWVGFLAVGGTTAATKHEAQYYQTVAQSIPNATDTRLKFNLAGDTANDVTASGVSNTTFTINRDGLWRISACIRVVAGGQGDRLIFLNAGSTMAVGSRFGMQNVIRDDIVNVAVSLSVSADIRLFATNVVEVGMFQASGAALNTDVGFGSSSFVSLTWMRP